MKVTYGERLATARAGDTDEISVLLEYGPRNRLNGSRHVEFTLFELFDDFLCETSRVAIGSYGIAVSHRKNSSH